MTSDQVTPTVLAVATLRERLGQEVAVSGWHTITQDQIDRFAALTGDDQWIHCDPARAAVSPFGATIAHGFLTLSLLTKMMMEAVVLEGAPIAINYGLNRIRFVTPVPAGGRLRGRFALTALAAAGPPQVTWTVTVELAGAQKPAVVAEWIVRYGDSDRPL